MGQRCMESLETTIFESGPAADYRPQPTLGLRSDSVGNAAVTCRSAENHVEGQLTDLANSHSVPFADPHIFRKQTFEFPYNRELREISGSLMYAKLKQLVKLRDPFTQPIPDSILLPSPCAFRC